MAKKSSSFLLPFVVSFSATFVIGWIVLYFGFYQSKISSYERMITEFENSSTVGTPIASYFEIDEMGIQRGTQQEEIIPKTTSYPLQMTKKSNPTQTENDQPTKTNQNETSKTGISTTSKTAETDTEVERKPAFPKTKSSASFQETNEKKSKEIPSMDDPEVADNPLLRALRMASEKNRKAANNSNTAKKAGNPLEAILKNRKE